MMSRAWRSVNGSGMGSMTTSVFAGSRSFSIHRGRPTAFAFELSPDAEKQPAALPGVGSE